MKKQIRVSYSLLIHLLLPLTLIAQEPLQPRAKSPTNSNPHHNETEDLAEVLLQRGLYFSDLYN